MAFTANTAFEVKVGNGIYNGIQNIAGKYGTLDGSTFTAADISAGFFAVQTALIPSEGYESIVDGSSNPTILNGNTWYMGVASSGIVTADSSRQVRPSISFVSFSSEYRVDVFRL